MRFKNKFQCELSYTFKNADEQTNKITKEKANRRKERQKERKDD